MSVMNQQTIINVQQVSITLSYSYPLIRDALPRRRSLRNPMMMLPWLRRRKFQLTCHQLHQPHQFKPNHPQRSTGLLPANPQKCKPLINLFSNPSLSEMWRLSRPPRTISHQFKRTPLREDMPLCFSVPPPNKSAFMTSMRTLPTSRVSMLPLTHSNLSLRTPVLEELKWSNSTNLLRALVLSTHWPFNSSLFWPKIRDSLSSVESLTDTSSFTKPWTRRRKLPSSLPRPSPAMSKVRFFLPSRPTHWTPEKNLLLSSPLTRPSREDFKCTPRLSSWTCPSPQDLTKWRVKSPRWSSDVNAQP